MNEIIFDMLFAVSVPAMFFLVGEGIRLGWQKMPHVKARNARVNHFYLTGEWIK